MLFGLAQSLRSLTASPMAGLVQEAHRMARRRLEAGGPAAPAPRPVKADPVPADYVLPLEVPADEVLKAIEAKLGDRDHASTGAPPLLRRKAGGRVAVSGYHILRLGDGRFDLGRRFMHRIINQIRTRRAGHKSDR